MNGWDWTLDLKCRTCGSEEHVKAPYDHTRSRLDHWLRSHDRHEFSLRQGIEKPPETAADEIGLATPDFMRTVAINEAG